MRLKSLLVAAFVGGFMVSSLYAHEQAAPGPDSSRAHHMWAKLGLSQKQQDQMKQLFADGKEKMKANFQASKDLRQKIKDELLKPNPDAAVLDAYAGKLAQLHEQMLKDRISGLFKAKQILTPDQFKKLLDMQEKRGNGFGGADHKGPHGDEK